VQRRELGFENDGISFRGTLTVPDIEGPWPGLVTLHPSSDGTRDARLFTHLEALLVPAGFAIFRYDRRGSGATGGNFDPAGFQDLAGDALAALSALAEAASVNRARMGFFGFSQGGWIGPEAASRSDAVAFLVLVGACAVTPARQMAYAAATALRAAGYGDEVVERALALRAAVDDAVRGRVAREAAREQVDAARGEPWFEHAFLPSGALEPSDDDEKWRMEMDYDIAPILAELSLPVLLIHGMHDRWTPIDESRQAWVEAYRSRPDRLSAVQLAGTGHFPTLAHGAEGEELAPISPDYEAILLHWLRGVAAKATV
jgi:uncharacterized protein